MCCIRPRLFPACLAAMLSARATDHLDVIHAFSQTLLLCRGIQCPADLAVGEVLWRGLVLQDHAEGRVFD